MSDPRDLTPGDAQERRQLLPVGRLKPSEERLPGWAGHGWSIRLERAERRPLPKPDRHRITRPDDLHPDVVAQRIVSRLAQDAQGSVDKLKDQLRTLNDKIEEAKRKKNILVARSKRAEAQQRIQETMSGLSDKSAFESFERMAEKIEATERKALAAAELNEEVSGDHLARQFEALEYKGSSDQQLLELKAKMGMLPSGRGGKGSKQLGKGKDDVRDAELIEEGDEGKAR